MVEVRLKLVGKSGRGGKKLENGRKEWTKARKNVVRKWKEARKGWIAESGKR